MRLWDSATGREIPQARGAFGAGRFGRLFAGRQAVASASDDNTVRLWDLASGRAPEAQGHSDWVFSVAFSPDGKVLVGRSGQNVRLWNVADGPELHGLAGHTKSRSGRSPFSPDGKPRVVKRGQDRQGCGTSPRAGNPHARAGPRRVSSVAFFARRAAAHRAATTRPSGSGTSPAGA